MNILKSTDKFLKMINKKLAQLCGILLFLIIILLVVNTVSRELGYPIEGLNSLSVLVLVAVVYLGLSITEQNDQHAAVEILPESLNKPSRKKLDILISVIKIVSIGIFLYAAVPNLFLSIQSGEAFADVVTIPIWPAKLAIVLGLFVFELQIILNFFKVIFNIDFSSEEDITENL